MGDPHRACEEQEYVHGGVWRERMVLTKSRQSWAQGKGAAQERNPSMYLETTWAEDEARTRVGVIDLVWRIHKVARRSVLGFASFASKLGASRIGGQIWHHH